MKTTLFALLLCFTFNVLADESTPQARLKVKMLAAHSNVATLIAADPKCPFGKGRAVHYYFVKIDAATNSVDLLAISNSIVAHK